MGRASERVTRGALNLHDPPLKPPLRFLPPPTFAPKLKSVEPPFFFLAFGFFPNLTFFAISHLPFLIGVSAPYMVHVTAAGPKTGVSSPLTHQRAAHGWRQIAPCPNSPRSPEYRASSFRDVPILARLARCLATWTSA